MSPILLCLFLFLTVKSAAYLPVPDIGIGIRNDIPKTEVHDVHELLPKYGLPKGLLPNNVKSYTLSDDGSFRIFLKSSCYVQFAELVYYDEEVKGKLSYGSITDVSGIQAKKLFLWLPVTAIKADPDTGMIQFFGGAISEKLPAKQFEDIPECNRKGLPHPQPQAISSHSHIRKAGYASE
ncbi:hypothetical protein L6164_025366 [Bauhinia variegata]|uniref:Uncharacterized protein n=1 Tax=Bauhinia variegata TaxID=167791 RepID=A0ACB9M0E6_BAUVA|nr:hypothetical protein L6164_025366 [Bauhinia variegata]